MQCSTVQCSAVQCSTVQCSAVQCSTVQCRAVQCSTVQCSAAQCSTVQYSADGTSHCEADEDLVKVSLVVDGRHLAAVLCGVGAGGVEDQDVCRLSELCPVLQVAWARGGGAPSRGQS